MSGDILQEDDDNEYKNNEKLNLDNLVNSFKSQIFSSNFDMVKCYNLVFNSNLLKNNKDFIHI